MTDRQKQIFEAIVQEFMKQAGAVGSMSIVLHHSIGVSPATVRNEMVDLANKGYLSKEHCSSGRIPTDLGLRFFIKELMEEEPLKNTDEVDMRIRVFRNRFDEEKLMSDILTFLSEETGYAALSYVNDMLRYRGLSMLLDYDELRDIEVLDGLLRILESKTILNRVLSGSNSEEEIRVVIGKESDIDGLNDCAIICSLFCYVGGKKGYLGVIGPRRMRYSKAIPVVKKVSRVLDNAVRGW